MTAALQSDKQILITGCYRTGTEYLTQLVGDHPDIEATMYVVNYLRYCLNQFNDINEEENLLSLLFDSARRIRQRWNKKLDVQQLVDRCKEAETISDAFLYDMMMCDLFLRDSEADIWLEKDQLEWQNIPAFLEMFPDGKVIHVFRDPRSVLASFREFTYTEPPAYLSAAFNTLDSMNKGLEYKQTFASTRYHQIRYEDLAKNTDYILNDLFDFLEVPGKPSQAECKSWDRPDGSEWTSNSAFSDEKPEDFDVEAAINRWKSHLDDWEVTLCETINQSVMTDYGYAPSDRPAVSWEQFVSPLLERRDLQQYLRDWIETGEGVEAFPTNPLDSDNWSENN